MSDKKHILITGGAGYIGSHAVKLFLKQGHSVVVFDNFFRGFQEPLEILNKYGDLSIVEGDLRNKEEINKVFNDYDIGSVLHFAALCEVDESMKQPELYFENNVVGSLNLFEAMRKNSVKNIIFSSTRASYGDAQYVPVDEQHPQVPDSPYGESKLLVEHMLGWYGKLHDFRYVILRYFNVCGTDSEGEIGDHDKQLLMQNAVRGALGIKPFGLTCPEVDTPDKTPIRDYIDVEDLVIAHFDAYNYLYKGGQSDVFNLGNGTGFSVKEIINMVEQVCDVVIEHSDVPKRQGESAKVFADPSKAQQALGWKSEKTLEQSIESLKKWYKNRPQGYSR